MRVYTVTLKEQGVISGTQTGTLIQLKSGANVVCVILRASITQSNITASTMQNVQIRRTTTAGTVTSQTPILTDKGDAAANSAGGAAATGVNATAEGTGGDVLYAADFNLLNGWLYVPVPEERIIVGPANPYLGIFLPTVPSSSVTMSATLVFGEIGS